MTLNREVANTYCKNNIIITGKIYTIDKYQNIIIINETKKYLKNIKNTNEKEIIFPRLFLKGNNIICISYK